MTAPRGMGWLPDMPDFRDLTVDSEPLKPLTRKLGLTAKPAKSQRLPGSVDLREHFSPVDDQGRLGACTAHAGTALLEYFERRAQDTYLDASRLFLYKVTRNLLGWTGDSGAFLRATMGAMALFGVPPEKYWRYDIPTFDAEPSAFLYSVAQSYRADTYYRLDPPGTHHDTLLARIRQHAAAGFPSMFGFTAYSSIDDAAATGAIAMPSKGEKVLGGHAICVAGYDDAKGALLIRNSWGPGWGDGGYGWLPYDYVMRGLATDWWTLIKAEWVDTERFGF